jgi:hypothetical protein
VSDIYEGYGPYGPAHTKLAEQEATKGVLQPGMEGWWPVWGARAIDIRPGDLLMIGWQDKEAGCNKFADVEVVEMASFKQPTMNSIRVGFITTSGVFDSVGMLQPVKVLRWGTHNTLADSI